MKKDKYDTIQTLDDNQSPLFYQRETGITQTPFELELVFFNTIKDGNVEAVIDMIETNLSKGLYYGRMSLNKLTQSKYLAICTISTSCHYAILGGLDETDAFNLSDEVIMKIDRELDKDNIIDNLYNFLITLTQRVHDTRYRLGYSDIIRRALHYIYIHLHDRITVQQLASATGLSKSYISTLFKKEVGITINKYIMQQKLEAAKTLLLSRPNTSSIGYYYGFCSESYFISCFKKAYGITPKAYIQLHT